MGDIFMIYDNQQILVKTRIPQSTTISIDRPNLQFDSWWPSWKPRQNRNLLTSPNNHYPVGQIFPRF